MWKTGESPRGGAVFCPHPTVETFNSFHRACERNFCPDFFHRLSFHISQGLWRKFGVRMGGGFGVDFFEMKPCPHLGGVPPAAPFLSRQERGKEGGLRELAAGQRPLEAASYRFSCRSKKTAAGGTQPKYGQGFRMKCFCFRAANCLAVPPKSLYRPSSVTALWAATASPRGSHFTGRR